MEEFVQVISRETLRPSSQTPPHPNKLKLSYLDQLSNAMYIPLIFFYQAEESSGLTASNHLQISQRLKQSLSDTLPSFYPLAGRVKKNLFVDCNDAGVGFVSAHARARLKDVMHRDDQVKQFMPPECTAFDHGRGAPLLVVQITFFECGGVVIGACISHKVSDLESAMGFIDAWAARFRGEAKPAQRSFGTATYFPTLGFFPWSRVHKGYISDENFRVKRLVFNKGKLDTLRRVATSEKECGIKDPTRVELVSAFIWKHFMEGRSKKRNSNKKYAAFHVVNLRSRTRPAGVLENVYGNCIMSAVALHADSDQDICFHDLIGRLRRSIRRIRGDYITKPLSKKSHIKDLVKLSFPFMMGRVEWCFFTSWIGFPMYDVDYGWGKPVLVTTPSIPWKNHVTLMSSKSGEDIELIVRMMPHDLKNLDDQIKLIPTN